MVPETWRENILAGVVTLMLPVGRFSASMGIKKKKKIIFLLSIID